MLISTYMRQTYSTFRTATKTRVSIFVVMPNLFCINNRIYVCVQILTFEAS